MACICCQITFRASSKSCAVRQLRRTAASISRRMSFAFALLPVPTIWTVFLNGNAYLIFLKYYTTVSSIWSLLFDCFDYYVLICKYLNLYYCSPYYLSINSPWVLWRQKFEIETIDTSSISSIGKYLQFIRKFLIFIVCCRYSFLSPKMGQER